MAQTYDAQTVEIARRVLTGAGVAIDIGAHTGDLLRQFVAASPTTDFIAVEPLPQLAEALRAEFLDVTVHGVALADFEGQTEFRMVNGSPQESSMFVREQREAGHQVTVLNVPVRRLDDLVDLDAKRVEFIKLDVEGAEALTLRGARR